MKVEELGIDTGDDVDMNILGDVKMKIELPESDNHYDNNDAGGSDTGSSSSNSKVTKLIGEISTHNTDLILIPSNTNDTKSDSKIYMM